MRQRIGRNPSLRPTGHPYLHNMGRESEWNRPFRYDRV
jgi:hypothetical protein